MAVSSMKYLFSYCLGLYVISFVSSYCNYWTNDCSKEYAYTKKIATSESIIFNMAFDIYSFVYLFFRIYSSSNYDERNQERIVYLAAFIFLTIFGLFTVTDASGFLSILVYSSVIGLTISSAALALLYKFAVLRKISVQFFRNCTARVLRRKKPRTQFSLECII